MRYVKTSSTSFEAAASNLPRAGTQKARILRFLEDAGDATREEIENYVGLSGNAVRPRVAELLEAGLIRETTETRKTRSGSQAAVLVANAGVGAEGEGRSKDGPGAEHSVMAPRSTDSGVEHLASPSQGAPPASSPYDCWVEGDA